MDGEDQRRKFAHYLWNAGVLVGELVGGRPAAEGNGDGEKEEKENGEVVVKRVQEEEDKWGEGRWWLSVEEEALWRVKGEKVLELGAGG